MARLGLGSRWKCIFANEWCEKKAAAYRAYFGPSPELVVNDVAKVSKADLPGRPDLVWASFPCQDLSLAGSGAGLDGQRSGTFTPFWKLMEGLAKDGREPRVIVLENVVGTLTSHGGADFSTIVSAFATLRYRVGAFVIDAARFLPHSRPRLFVVGTRGDTQIPLGLEATAPSQHWCPDSLVKAQQRMSETVRACWTWWCLPIPREFISPLASLIEDRPGGVELHSQAETQKILSLMSPLHRKKVECARQVGGRQIGTIYKRTRPNKAGIMAQRAEVRFDGISGCLRTPVGGSSRQTVMIVERGRVLTRLLSPREAARLMGVPDDYPLPAKYNDAYHVFGDGVAVPVVRWIEKHLLYPLAMAGSFEQVA
jgi:DNA (cytosine-5)-methyltransferase 1